MFRGGVASCSELHILLAHILDICFQCDETLRFWCFFGKIYEKGDTYWDSFYIVVQE